MRCSVYVPNLPLPPAVAQPRLGIMIIASKDIRNAELFSYRDRITFIFISKDVFLRVGSEGLYPGITSRRYLQDLDI